MKGRLKFHASGLNESQIKIPITIHNSKHCQEYKLWFTSTIRIQANELKCR